MNNQLKDWSQCSSLGLHLILLGTVENCAMQTRRGEFELPHDISHRHTRDDSLGCGKEIAEPILFFLNLYFWYILSNLIVSSTIFYR